MSQNAVAQTMTERENLTQILLDNSGEEEVINLEDLKVDHRYQRDIIEPHVKKIIREFAPSEIQRLTISERGDGTKLILDGQHRIEALKRMGILRTKCTVHRGLSVKREAKMFLNLNMKSKSVTAYDRFKARVVAGDVEAIRMKRVLTALGLRFSKNGKAKRDIRPVATAEVVYKRLGDRGFRMAMELLKELWPFQGENLFQQFTINGARHFVEHFVLTGKVSLQDAIARLNRHSFSEAQGKANEYKGYASSGKTKAFAKGLAAVYNKGLRRNKRLELSSLD